MSADNIAICPKCHGEGYYAVNSLREYTNMGVNEFGILEIHYGCKCQNCDFEFTYKEKINVNI